MRLQNICITLLLLFALNYNGLSQNAKPTAEVQDSVYQKLGKVWTNSIVLPGYGQIYNKQYWKLPIVYTGIGTLAYFGRQEALAFRSDTAYIRLFPDFSDAFTISSKEHWHKRSQYYRGLAAFVWLTALDVAINYEFEGNYPARATVYSTMLPGLGQIYNKKYYKVPIIYAVLAGAGYYAGSMNTQYQRYLNALRNKEDIDYYTYDSDYNVMVIVKDARRRDRDIGYLVFGLAYLLQVLDANVDANMIDYDISDDLSFEFTPVLFENKNVLASSHTLGLGLTFNF